MLKSSYEIKSPEELAEEVKQVGHEAAAATQGYVSVARDIAGDAKDVAEDAAATGRAYANGVGRVAGRKFAELKDKAGQLQQDCTRYIAQEPVKATLISAAGGALLMALMMSAARSPRRRYD